MKTVFKTALLIAALIAGGNMTANAQLGNILKKVKKAAETVTGKATDSSDTDAATTKAVAIPSGGTMENPLASAVDIELVGAYGKTTSANYGEVYLVLKVKMLANKSRISLSGGIQGGKTMAVDQDGNTYFSKYTVSDERQVTEGVFVNVKLDSERGRFVDVKKTATTLQLIKLACFIDSDHHGFIQFKDVPVKWDVEP